MRVTTSQLQRGPQGPGKQGEARPLGRIPHLWAESPGQLPSKPPWGCCLLLTDSLYLDLFFFFFADEKENPHCVSCCPWDLRCPRERQLHLQTCFLSSSSGLGAPPTQGSHLTLLLTAALPAVSLPPKCLITGNIPLPVPSAISELRLHGLGPVLSA